MKTPETKIWPEWLKNQKAAQKAPNQILIPLNMLNAQGQIESTLTNIHLKAGLQIMLKTISNRTV